MKQSASSERTRAKRMPQRADYSAETIRAILDEALICHLGFVADGQPFVIPTLQVRIGDRIVVHGSAASRTLRAAGGGIQVCVEATLMDGLVLARSAFHHSLNYRSVVIFGQATVVIDNAAKVEASRALVEKIAPGRWADIRPPSAKELAATTFLSIPIDEASAKVATGGRIDDAEDLEMGAWAGVVPMRLVAMEPIADATLRAGIAMPSHVHDIADNSAIFRGGRSSKSG
jgi:hypothetical protein